MATGTVSSKYQLTLPAEVRKALGVKPGDTVEYKVKQGALQVRLVRPNAGEVLKKVLAEQDFSGLQEETGGDAVKYVRDLRGLDD